MKKEKAHIRQQVLQNIPETVKLDRKLCTRTKKKKSLILTC